MLLCPHEPFRGTTWYTVRVTGDVKDLLGNPLAADYGWSFCTFWLACLLSTYRLYCGVTEPGEPLGNRNEEGETPHWPSSLRQCSQGAAYSSVVM